MLQLLKDVVNKENNDSSPYRYFFPIIVFDPEFRQAKLFEQVVL